MCDLVVGMLQYNVEERFVMRDVLLHKWTVRKYVRYQTGRLKLPETFYRLPPESITVLPYRVTLEHCDHLHYLHKLHHVYQRQSADDSTRYTQVYESGKTNPEATEGLFNPEGKGFALPIVQRKTRIEFDWIQIYANIADFGAKAAVLEALAALTRIQNLRSFNNIPAIQDAMSLLQAVLLLQDLCSIANWKEICQEACVKLHFAIQSLDKLKEALQAHHQNLSSDQVRLLQLHSSFL